MSRIKRHHFNGWAGCVTVRKNQHTGTRVGLYVAEQAGMDPDGGAWVTLCEDHATLVNHLTRKHATFHMADPSGWCEDCRELLEQAEEKAEGPKSM